MSHNDVVQNHYDFGMRAIKSVLVMAGQLKRNLQIRFPVFNNRSYMYIIYV